MRLSCSSQEQGFLYLGPSVFVSSCMFSVSHTSCGPGSRWPGDPEAQRGSIATTLTHLHCRMRGRSDVPSSVLPGGVKGTVQSQRVHMSPRVSGDRLEGDEERARLDL